MIHHPKQPVRRLAIAPASTGVGYAMLEDREKLVDWGVKVIQGDKNAGALKKLKDLITHFQPHVLVLEDALAGGSRRSPRIKTLQKQIVGLAASHNLRVKLFSREQVMKSFLASGQGTKSELAATLAARFPEELSDRLPPKRRPWMSEDYRMALFEAVALVLTMPRKPSSRTAPSSNSTTRER